jgi:hypothetical protein
VSTVRILTRLAEFIRRSLAYLAAKRDAWLRPVFRYVARYPMQIALGATWQIIEGAAEATARRSAAASAESSILIHRSSAANVDGALKDLVMEIIAERSRREHIGPSATSAVVLTVPDTMPAGDFQTIARMLGSRTDLHIAWDQSAAADTLEAELFPAATRRPTTSGPEPGARRLYVPELYRLAAREFMKTMGPTLKFCAVSVPGGMSPAAVESVLRKHSTTPEDWRFLFLGSGPTAARADHWTNLPVNAVSLDSSGADLAFKIGVVCEADAFVGIDDVFAAVAIDRGVPVHLLELSVLPMRAEASAS